MIQDTDAQNELKGNYRRFSVDISGGVPIIFGDVKNKAIGYDVAGRFNWNITSALSIGTELGIGFVKGEEGTREYFSNKYIKALIGGELYLFNILKFNQLSSWFQPYAGYNFGGIKSDIETSHRSNHFNDWIWAHQFNAGAKFKLTNMIDLNVSGNFMYTGTDYLDNYNPNVNQNKYRDALSTIRVGLTLHLGKKGNPSIIWKEGNEIKKVKKTNYDSIQTYNQGKMYEIDNKVVALERQNNKLNTKVVTSEQKVDKLESQVQSLENKNYSLEEQLRNVGSLSANNASNGSIETTVYFSTSSDEVPSKERDKLREIANYLSVNPNAKVLASGYTDKRGDELYNLKLSNKRALKVKRELIRLGVPAYKIEAFGYGENHLLPDSDQGNRRVVVTVK